MDSSKTPEVAAKEKELQEKEPKKPKTRTERRAEERLNADVNNWVEKRIQEYFDELFKLETQYSTEIAEASLTENEDVKRSILNVYNAHKTAILDIFSKRYNIYIRNPKFMKAGLHYDPAAMRRILIQEEENAIRLATMPQGTPEELAKAIQENAPKNEEKEEEEAVCVIKIGDKEIKTSKLETTGAKIIKAAKLEEGEKLMQVTVDSFEEVDPNQVYTLTYTPKPCLEFKVVTEN